MRLHVQTKNNKGFHETLRRTTIAILLSSSLTLIAAENYVDIPSQSLDKALSALAKQSKVRIEYSVDSTKKFNAPSIQGNLSTRQVIDALLKNTSFTVQGDSEQGYSVIEKTAQNSAIPDEALPEVTITATKDKETATSPVIGYLAKRSATATKTDTPIIETPASVQVITRDVIDDQKALSLKDVYENVSGVQQAGNTLNAQTEVLPIIRGFESPTLLRNGLRSTMTGAVDLINVERVEVLKGPSSILFGAIEPGGIVNYVTKRPQAEASHTLTQEFGNFDYFRTSGDTTGALNADESLLYRLNFAYTDSDSYRDYMKLERSAIAPSLLWKISDQTELLLDFSYSKEKQPYDTGIPLDAEGKPLTSREAFFGYPDLDGRSNEDVYAGYQLTHILNPTWTIRNQLQYHRAHSENEALRARSVFGNSLRMRYQNEDRVDDEVQFVLDATAKFSTGAVDHTFLIGTDLIKQESDFDRFRVNTPNYAISDSPNVNFNPPANQTQTKDISKTDWMSIYFQDQMSLLSDDRLKLLIGGRFDDVVTKSSADGIDTVDIKDQAFTGRAGMLYMLSDNHSVYFSSSQSFRPQFAFAVDINGKPLDPETGRQYEVGFKSAFFNEKLLSTISVFEIKKKNVAVFDQSLFDSTGQNAYFPGVKQESRGFEFDLAGNLTDQLKVIANYSYTDTQIIENQGDLSQEGLPIGGVSPHAARIWMSYNFKGPLNGLGIGGGVRYVGESTAQFDPNLEIDPYRVTDIAAWYSWDNIKASINVKNLFDEEYIVRASNNSIAHYGAARTIIGSVSINF